MRKTLADAIAAGEGVTVTTRTRAGVVQHRCEATGCRVWRPAFALRDLRESEAFGAAGFVCDDCEGKLARVFQKLGWV